MRDYKEELCKGIYLHDHELFLEWKNIDVNYLKGLSCITGNEQKNLLGNRIEYCTIYSRIFDSKKSFIMTFYFVNNKFADVVLGTDDYREMNSEQRFNENQKFLEKKIGKPQPLSFLKSLLKEKEDMIYQWKFGKVKITNSLFDTKLRTTLRIEI